MAADTPPAPAPRCACGFLRIECKCPAPEGAGVLTRSERIREDQKKGTGDVTAVMVSTNFEPWTLCAQCGPRADVDEDGCCTSCGSDALQLWGPDPTIALRAELEARADAAEAEVESLRRNGDRALRAAYAQRDALLKALREVTLMGGNYAGMKGIAAAAIKEAENA